MRALSGQGSYQEDRWLHAPQEKQCGPARDESIYPPNFLQNLNKIMLLQPQS